MWNSGAQQLFYYCWPLVSVTPVITRTIIKIFKCLKTVDEISKRFKNTFQIRVFPTCLKRSIDVTSALTKVYCVRIICHIVMLGEGDCMR